MKKPCDWRITCLLAILQWLAMIIPSSAYFQASVDGYLFLMPGFNDLERRTQVNAQSWCTGNQSKLLEIRNGDVQSSAARFINNAMKLNQITGNIVMTNGRRVNMGLTWMNGIAYSSTVSVKGQEPGFSNSYGYLNSAQSRFEFIVDSPTTNRGYICEGSSFCAGGFTVNGRCYKSYIETLSWFDARSRCITIGNGDLASFNFIADDRGFVALNGSGLNPSSTYWIGLRRQQWTWQDSRSEVVYSQWFDGHPTYTTSPNSDCLCLLPNNPVYDWKWTECDCSLTYQFVCMTGTGLTSTTTSSTTTSSTTTPSTTTASTTTPSTTRSTLASTLGSTSGTSSGTTGTTSGTTSVTPSGTTSGTTSGTATGSTLRSTSQSTINGITSTSLITFGPPSLSLPSSASNSESMVTTVLGSSTSESVLQDTSRVIPGTSVSPDTSSNGGLSVADLALPIGLGVGIGGGALLISVILVVVFVTTTRKGCPRKSEPQTPSSDPPDVARESYYAGVVKNAVFDDTTLHVDGGYSSISHIPPPPEYADLNIGPSSSYPNERDHRYLSFA